VNACARAHACGGGREGEGGWRKEERKLEDLATTLQKTPICASINVSYCNT
jgi:hypothetical protein